MWIDTRTGNPLEDGYYLVQTIYESVSPMSYTREYGWNTVRLNDGSVYKDDAIESAYIARWLYAQEPAPVPKEWYDAYKKELL